MPRNSHLHRVRTRNHLAIAACLLAFALRGCSDPQEDIPWGREVGQREGEREVELELLSADSLQVVVLHSSLLE